jgi:hypothetical protein
MIEIIVPTRNRLDKLRRMLLTLPAAANGLRPMVTVVCDGDPGTAASLIENPLVDRVLYLRKRRGSVFSRNLAAQVTEGDLLYATDDIEFLSGSIQAAAQDLEKHFPDKDGVIGFTQINASTFSPAGVALVGQIFLRRFPNRKLFYPGYDHFCCQEIERLAEAIQRLYLSPDARLVHHHPSFEAAEADSTHAEARSHRQMDRNLSTQRRQKGIIWGSR